MRVRRGLLTLPMAVLLAACGGANASSGPPSARTLAKRIPGCSDITKMTPAVIEIQDVECNLPDGGVVEIGTFPNSRDEQQWISDGGSPMSPDPGNSQCCIQGKLWAATVDNSGSLGQDFSTVMAAIGGREITG
jgi:hypothetical protein